MERRTYLVNRWLLRLVVTLMFLQLNPNMIKASSVVEPAGCWRFFVFSSSPFSTVKKYIHSTSVSTTEERSKDLDSIYEEAETSLDKKINDQLHQLGFWDSNTSIVTDSIDQLFIKKKILFNIKEFRDMLKHMNSELAKLLQDTIKSSTDYRKVVRTEEGYWNLPFIAENIDIIRSFSKNDYDAFLKMAPKGEVEKLFEKLKAEIKSSLTQYFETEAKSVYLTSYDMWLKSESSDFSLQQHYIENALLSAIKSHIIQLLNNCKSKYSVFSSLNVEEIFQSLYQKYVQNLHSKKEHSPIRYHSTEDSLSFEVSDPKIKGRFDPDLSTIYLYQQEQSLDYSPNLLFLHGASTFTSNAASFIEIINRVQNSFYTGSTAIDLPGSMGDKGVVSNKISNPLEISIFLNRWFKKEQSQRNGSNVAFGRSLGSTFAFANAFYNFIYHRPSYVDMYMLTSFSNPFTMDYQLQAVQELAQKDPSVTLVPGFEKHLMAFINSLKQDLINIKNNNPELVSSFGYNMLFLQGEADADGGESVIEDLHSFVDTYVPKASVYEIKDPLKQHPQIAEKFGSDNREASHFLLNGRANMDVKHLNIPEEFAPKFFDQSLEVIVLQRAWLDFIIDLSPFTPKELKASLLEKRIKYTGSDEKFAYLKKILSDLSKDLPTKYGISLNLDLDHIINELNYTDTPQTIEDRIKKVLCFIEQEYNRQKLDANINEDTSSLVACLLDD